MRENESCFASFLIMIILTVLLSVTIWFLHEDTKTLAVIYNNHLAQITQGISK
jgi:hypothetical protein